MCVCVSLTSSSSLNAVCIWCFYALWFSLTAEECHCWCVLSTKQQSWCPLKRPLVKLLIRAHTPHLNRFPCALIRGAGFGWCQDLLNTAHLSSDNLSPCPLSRTFCCTLVHLHFADLCEVFWFMNSQESSELTGHMWANIGSWWFDAHGPSEI